MDEKNNSKISFIVRNMIVKKWKSLGTNKEFVIVLDINYLN